MFIMRYNKDIETEKERETEREYVKISLID